MSVFISNFKNKKISVSQIVKSNNFKLAERLIPVADWGGAAASIEDCGSSDSGATPDLDLLILVGCSCGEF